MQNSRPRGRNFAINWAQGEVLSLHNFFFFKNFLSITTYKVVVTNYYLCILFLLHFDGNSMCSSQLFLV